MLTVRSPCSSMAVLRRQLQIVVIIIIIIINAVLNQYTNISKVRKAIGKRARPWKVVDLLELEKTSQDIRFQVWTSPHYVEIAAILVSLQKQIWNSICDIAHEKVPNGENGAMSIVVQRTYQGIKRNKNQWKILSSLQDREFLLENRNHEIYFKN